MPWGDGEWRWVLTDAYGRSWNVSVPSSHTRAHASGALLPRIPTSALEDLVEDAFAPWGSARDETIADLLEICGALTGRDFEREHLHRRHGETGWRQRLDTILAVLLDAAESGWLVCEPVARVALAVPEDSPDTLREPPRPEPEATTWFELQVVDEAGVPVPGLEIAFSLSGDRRTVVTNGAGIARVDGIGASFGSARVASAATVKELLEPRWQTYRPIRLPQGEHVTVQALRDTFAAVSIESETPHTLVIVPHHRRVRLVGMHFDTNKCFLLPSAMHGIRRVKAIYDESETTEILVVGHTDSRGERKYNEKLSLERAEALVAFLKDDVDTWNKWFSASAQEKTWGDREVNAMLSALPEGEPPFTSAGNASRDPEAIKRFQRWSNETRGTTLVEDGVAGPLTRRALIEAYMALDHTTLPKETKIVAHGCGPNHPLPDEGDVPPADAEQRRVDLFAFDGPIRPPPPGTISGPSSPEYAQWVAQMHSTFDVRSDVLSFRYGLEVGPAQQWSEAATITLFSEDLQDVESFVLAQGEPSGPLRVFEFSGIRPGIRYRAEISEGDLAMPLFGLTELHAIALDDSPDNHLATPSANPAAPFDYADPEEHDVLRVRLFDSDGNVMTNALYRLSAGDQIVGYAEDGWAAVRIPQPHPAQATLEWGEPNDNGVLTYSMDLSLDCNETDEGVSNMLHNLGYPHSRPLEARVRAFQLHHDVGEHGLGQNGAIPPRTRSAIVKEFTAKSAE